MQDQLLDGCRIVVVEDEYLIANDIANALEEAGATVLGPVPSAEAAASLIADEPRIDGALLDINLGGSMVFDIADTLVSRAIPFAFVTGYDRWAIPERFADAPRLEKPVKPKQVAQALGPILSAG